MPAAIYLTFRRLKIPLATGLIIIGVLALAIGALLHLILRLNR